ncbi:MAG: STAS domain-containing protein [Eubacteriaceae bacterium]|nr:STAS domain-containing protein [Eubacteriaceae bacterium]
MLTINKGINEGTAVFTLEGRLDTNTSPDLEKELNENLEGITDLTMDFASLDYISSAGLRVLLSTQKAMAKKGELKVTNVNDTIMDIFEMTGFTEILSIVPASKEAGREE